MMKAVLSLLVCLAFGTNVDACVCTRDFNPVCGSDGKTYNNPCLAGCQSVDVACDGQCPCPPPAGKKSGSDESSDSSESESGEGDMVTEAPTPPCICPFIYLPVCGSNGKTYGNACGASCESVDVACDGQCPCPPPPGSNSGSDESSDSSE